MGRFIKRFLRDVKACILRGWRRCCINVNKAVTDFRAFAVRLANRSHKVLVSQP